MNLPKGAGRSSDAAFTIDSREVDAIAVAYDELVSYLDVVGNEGQLDDEEMPTEKLTCTVAQLRAILDRYAKYEALTAAVARHGGVVQVEPVRFTYRPDTPASGPTP